MKHTCRILCLIITALGLGACGFSQYYGPNIQTGIDGKWLDENGIISSFQNGVLKREQQIQKKNYQKVPIIMSVLNI